MNEQEILSKLEDILFDHLGSKSSHSVALDACMSDFVSDSLDMLELIMEVEAVFDISIANVHNIVTIAQLVNIIEEELDA